MNRPNEQHSLWIDNLRALACIFVVLLHVSAPWLTEINHKDWIFLSVIHTITRSSVPIFIMISGALLLPKKITWTKFYSDRFSKIWRPFLFWTSLYTIIFLVYSIYNGASYNFITQLTFVYNSFVFGAAYHLWYMYLIMLFYICLLFIGDIDSKINQNQMRAFLLLWVLILSAYQFSTRHVTLNYLHLIFGYFGYFVLGHYLNKYIEVINKWFCLLIIGAAIFFTVYPILIQVGENGKYPLEWYSYRSINIMILSIGIFLFFKSTYINSKIASLISKRSFGIYLIHLLMIMLLNKLWFVPSNIPISIYVLLFSLLSALMSYYSILLLEKVPVLRKYIY
jgi:surface polysaccharide O-acyltransferase-like enzyme